MSVALLAMMPVTACALKVTVDDTSLLVSVRVPREVASTAEE